MTTMVEGRAREVIDSSKPGGVQVKEEERETGVRERRGNWLLWGQAGIEIRAASSM